MEAARDKAMQRRTFALLAFPVAGKLYSEFTPASDQVVERLKSWKSFKVRWTAVERALAGARVASKIDTSDLLSPYDGKPLRYSYDGKHIHIELDSDDPASPTRLSVPAEPFKRR